MTIDRAVTLSDAVALAEGHALCDEPLPRPCALCGSYHAPEAMPLTRWAKKSFNGYAGLHYRGSDAHICVGCLTLADEKRQVPGREKPQKMRNYSHLVTTSPSWELATKAAERRRTIRAFLFGEQPHHWAAAIAQSGQKHIAFFARLNPPHARDIWLTFEDETTRVSLDELERLLRAYERAYHSGFTKAEIDSGDYLPHRIAAIGPAAWRDIEAELAEARGTTVFCVASHLSLSAEDAGYDLDERPEDSGPTSRSARKAPRAARPVDPGRAAPTPRQHRSKRPHPLGSNPGDDAGPGAPVHDDRTVDEPRAEISAGAGSRQLSLF